MAQGVINGRQKAQCENYTGKQKLTRCQVPQHRRPMAEVQKGSSDVQDKRLELVSKGGQDLHQRQKETDTHEARIRRKSDWGLARLEQRASEKQDPVQAGFPSAVSTWATGHHDHAF